MDMTKEERDTFTQELKKLFNFPKDLDSVPISTANFLSVLKLFEGKKYCGTEIVCKGRVAVRTELADTSNDEQPFFGIQCLRDFKAHETIFVSPGIYLDRKIDTHIYVIDDHDGKKLAHKVELDAYGFDWGDKWELPVCVTFINHSCDPNAYWKGINDPNDEGCEPGGVGVGPLCIIKARRDIKAGEFVHLDYDTAFFDAPHPFRCLCGSSPCKGIIKGFDSLLEEEQDKMITEMPYVFDPTWLAVWLGEHLKDEERRKKLLKGLNDNELMPNDNMAAVKEIIADEDKLLGYAQ